MNAVNIICFRCKVTMCTDRVDIIGYAGARLNISYNVCAGKLLRLNKLNNE